MSKIKTYHVFVNCVNFHRYAVEATSREEANYKAERAFQCDGTEGEAVDKETHLLTSEDDYGDLITSEEYDDRKF